VSVCRSSEKAQQAFPKTTKNTKKRLKRSAYINHAVTSVKWVSPKTDNVPTPMCHMPYFALEALYVFLKQI
jgi:hypothetical protein